MEIEWCWCKWGRARMHVRRGVCSSLWTISLTVADKLCKVHIWIWLHFPHLPGWTLIRGDERKERLVFRGEMWSYNLSKKLNLKLHTCCKTTNATQTCSTKHKCRSGRRPEDADSCQTCTRWQLITQVTDRWTKRMLRMSVVPHQASFWIQIQKDTHIYTYTYTYVYIFALYNIYAK